MINNYQASDFKQCLNQRFSIRFGSGDASDATLAEVNESSANTFAVLFRLSHPTGAPQGIHTISHEKLGRMDLFLVPVGPDTYEAVFNYST